MACKDYGWQKVKHVDILGVVKWFQNKFNLRDWEITVVTGSVAPDRFQEDEKEEIALARCSTALRRLMALIWIPLDRLKNNNTNSIQATIHEMLHVFVNARGIVVPSDEDDNPEERIVYSLEGPVYELYCLERKKKIPKVDCNLWVRIKE